jgi:hypothetical protein
LQRSRLLVGVGVSNPEKRVGVPALEKNGAISSGAQALGASCFDARAEACDGCTQVYTCAGMVFIHSNPRP